MNGGSHEGKMYKESICGENVSHTISPLNKNECTLIRNEIIPTKTCELFRCFKSVSIKVGKVREMRVINFINALNGKSRAHHRVPYPECFGNSLCESSFPRPK